MAENGPFGTPLFDPQNLPEKVYVGPFLRPFPGNEAHKLFFLGAQNGVFWVGAKKFRLKKFMCVAGSQSLREGAMFESAPTSLRAQIPKKVRKELEDYTAPIGAFFCAEIRALTGFGARFLRPLPKSSLTVKYYSNTTNGR